MPHRPYSDSNNNIFVTGYRSNLKENAHQGNGDIIPVKYNESGSCSGHNSLVLVVMIVRVATDNLEMHNRQFPGQQTAIVTQVLMIFLAKYISEISSGCV